MIINRHKKNRLMRLIVLTSDYSHDLYLLRACLKLLIHSTLSSPF